MIPPHRRPRRFGRHRRSRRRRRRRRQRAPRSRRPRRHRRRRSTPTTTTMAPTTTTTLAETTTTVAPETTTTTTAPAVAVAVVTPVCVHQIQPGDSLSAIVSAVADPALTVEAVVTENGLSNPNTINAGDTLDLCIGNGIDDVTGQPRVVAPRAGGAGHRSGDRRSQWHRRGRAAAEAQRPVRRIRSPGPRCRRRVRAADRTAVVRGTCRPRPAGEPRGHGARLAGRARPDGRHLLAHPCLGTGGRRPLGAHRPDLSDHVRR